MKGERKGVWRSIQKVIAEAAMSLTHLVEKTRKLMSEDPRAGSWDWHDCAYLVLREEFGVEPSPEEVQELAKAAKPGNESPQDFFTDSDGNDPKEKQTGGGRRIVHKPEILGG